jgi:hypothetical protein
LRSSTTRKLCHRMRLPIFMDEAGEPVLSATGESLPRVQSRGPSSRWPAPMTAGVYARYTPGTSGVHQR